MRLKLTELNKEAILGLTAIGMMVASAAIIVVRTVTPYQGPVIDTRYESGSHLTFIFVAPTSKGDRDYVDAVRRAKTAMRAEASRRGHFFSTVGVSDAWSTKRGLQLLHEFGAFDELVVGRNWFNTGINTYVTEMGGRPAVPQVLVFVQEVRLETVPITYGERRELLRLVGREAMHEWAEAGFLLPAGESVVGIP